MEGKHKTFVDLIKDRVGEHAPTEKELKVGQMAEDFYINLRGGDTHKCVTKTMAMYTAKVLPELSMEKAMELCQTVHTLIATVLTYLVEDGIIKEE